MKLYKPQNLKTSQEVREFSKGKEKRFIIPYKGGQGVVINSKVKRIYIGRDALKQAKLNK